MSNFQSVDLEPTPVVLNYVAGDRLPQIVMQITDSFGVPVPLTGYDVCLTVRRVRGDYTSSSPVPTEDTGWTSPRPCIIMDEELGVVYYDVGRSDTEVPPGEFELVFQIMDGVDLVATAPTEGDSTVIIRDRPFPFGVLVDAHGAILMDDDSLMLTNPGL